MLELWPRKIELVRNLYDFDPQDIANAFKQTAIARYGENSLGPVLKNLFWNKPSTLLSIKTDLNKETLITYGWVRVNHGSFSADFCVCPYRESGGNDPIIICYAKVKNQKEAENFLAAVENHITQNSIYKGKAINLVMGNFLDLSGINDKDLVYNEEVLGEIRAHLWTVIEKPEICAKLNIRRQRKVLLAGPYGAGKTLTALIAAKKAVANDLTFIYCPPTDRRDNLAINRAFNFARFYQPAVVFIEDIDEEQRINDGFALRWILEAMDGIVSKSDEIIVIMSTTRADKIYGALQRPGRIDKIINLGKLNAEDIKKMVATVIQPNLLSENIRWEEVFKYCNNYTPAFIKEIATNALLCMISQEKEKVTEEMIIKATKSLESQFQACQKSLGFQT